MNIGFSSGRLLMLPAILVALTAAGCGSGDDENGGSSDVTWKPYSSERFEVQFPATPRARPGEDPGEEMISTQANGLAFGVYYVDVGEFDPQTTTPESILDGGRTGAVRQVQGIELSHESIQLGEHPGQSFRVDMPSRNALSANRTYLVGTRMYLLSVAGPKDRFDDQLAGKFFDSFRLK